MNLIQLACQFKKLAERWEIPSYPLPDLSYQFHKRKGPPQNLELKEWVRLNDRIDKPLRGTGSNQELLEEAYQLALNFKKSFDLDVDFTKPQTAKEANELLDKLKEMILDLNTEDLNIDKDWVDLP